MSDQALKAEILLLLGALALGVVVPRLRSAPFRAAEQALGRLARRRGLCFLLVGILPLALRAAYLPFLPIPEPATHDDFSHLLAADTFASGRLTNPPHPLWMHFESFHIIQQPTYMSMYPPAQGMLLAAGKILFGHPWAGVFVSIGLMGGATLWMLEGWLPPGWALLGAILAVLRVGVLSYWMNSYSGGAAPAAIGGALLLGAVARLRRERKMRHGLLLALGVAILANSRPYEGLVLCLTAAGALLAWRVFEPRVVAPAFLLLAATALGMGYYFCRVTGSPLRMPYQVNRDTYAPSSVFIWRAPRPAPAYHHLAMRSFYMGWELPEHLAGRKLEKLPVHVLRKLKTLDLFYLGPALSLPLFMLPYVLRDRRMRFLACASAVSMAGVALEVWFAPHYASPITSAIFALVVQCMRHLRVCRCRWRRWPIPGTPSEARARNGALSVGPGMGWFTVRVIPLVCFFMMVANAASPSWPRSLSCWGGEIFRGTYIHRLNGQPGQHLVIVRYKLYHDPLREWVYNEADPDRAKIVWAREMDAASNRRLLEYFKERHAWLLEPDEIPPRFSVYPDWREGPSL